VINYTAILKFFFNIRRLLLECCVFKVFVIPVREFSVWKYFIDKDSFANYFTLWGWGEVVEFLTVQIQEVFYMENLWQGVEKVNILRDVI